MMNKNQIARASQILRNLQALSTVADVIRGKTLKEAGEKANVTPERVRQMVAKTLREIRPIAAMLDDRDPYQEWRSRQKQNSKGLVAMARNNADYYLPIIDMIGAKQTVEFARLVNPVFEGSI